MSVTKASLTLLEMLSKTPEANHQMDHAALQAGFLQIPLRQREDLQRSSLMLGISFQSTFSKAPKLLRASPTLQRTCPTVKLG